MRVSTSRVARPRPSWDTIPVSMHLRFVATLTAVVVLSLGACDTRCAEGSMRICRAPGDCRCGKTCRRNDECSGRDQCVAIAGLSVGACADPLWALNNPACLPLCNERDVCVDWGSVRACGAPCSQPSDCASNCCAGLSDGTAVCAPDPSYCSGTCNPPCTGNALCIRLGSLLTCTNPCASDADCPDRCCLPLNSGGGACAPSAGYCPAPPPDPCPSRDDCVRVETFTTPASGEADGGGACSAGRLTTVFANQCEEAVVCSACPSGAGAASGCFRIGPIPPWVTLPAETTCAAADVTIATHCVPSWAAEASFDCLRTRSP